MDVAAVKGVVDLLQKIIDKMGAVLSINAPIALSDSGNNEEEASITLLDLLKLNKDNDLFWSDYFGVAVENFKKWRDWTIKGCECTGVNRNGKPCKIIVYNVECRRYKPGITDRCKHHSLDALIDKASNPNCSTRTLENIVTAINT